MTCNDFRLLTTTKLPRECTTAEAAAHFKHIATCRDCQQWLVKDLDSTYQFSPGERSEMEVTAAKVANDTEAMDLFTDEDVASIGRFIKEVDER